MKTLTDGLGRRHWVIAEVYGYASGITSDVPIVVQHTRLDSRQAENALLSTLAYPDDG